MPGKLKRFLPLFFSKRKLKAFTLGQICVFEKNNSCQCSLETFLCFSFEAFKLRKAEDLHWFLLNFCSKMEYLTGLTSEPQ